MPEDSTSTESAESTDDTATPEQPVATGAEEPGTGKPEAEERAGRTFTINARTFTINAQYVKDLSFEAPNSPAVLTTAPATKPDITVNVDVQATGIKDKHNVFEVVLNTTAECKTGDVTAFVVELSYGGLFTLNVPEDHRKPVLLIDCPRLLFPFARNIVADITRDAGFPPLMMNPLDFASMYQDSIRNRSASPPTEPEPDSGPEPEPGPESGSQPDSGA